MKTTPFEAVLNVIFGSLLPLLVVVVSGFLGLGMRGWTSAWISSTAIIYFPMFSVLTLMGRSFWVQKLLFQMVGCLMATDIWLGLETLKEGWWFAFFTLQDCPILFTTWLAAWVGGQVFYFKRVAAYNRMMASSSSPPEAGNPPSGLGVE